MPRLFIPPENLRGERATLDRAAHRHLVKVLRLGRGDVVHLFDGAGTEIEARIEELGSASVQVVLGKRRRLPVPACAITLLVSPPRGERMDLIVQKTTELGVAGIVPVTSARTVMRASSHQRRRWQTIADQASRQSGRADIPIVSDPVPLGEAVAGMTGTGSPRLMLWEGEHTRSLGSTLTNGPRAVTLLVGPEGGFAPAEVDLAGAAGFVPVGLGPRILRSETAALVAVAMAQAAAGGLEWRPEDRQ